MSNRLTSPHIWMPEESVEANARIVLPAMVREYFDKGRKIAAKQPGASHLHPFRLATKRIRYTLEIFQDVYGPALKDRLEELKPVQDALGAVNDCVATADEFSYGKKFGKYLSRRGKKKSRTFYEVWKEQFDTPGKEDAWVQFLCAVPDVVTSLKRRTDRRTPQTGH